jgi:hypothetical protein
METAGFKAEQPLKTPNYDDQQTGALHQSVGHNTQSCNKPRKVSNLTGLAR